MVGEKGTVPVATSKPKGTYELGATFIGEIWLHCAGTLCGTEGISYAAPQSWSNIAPHTPLELNRSLKYEHDSNSHPPGPLTTVPSHVHAQPTRALTTFMYGVCLDRVPWRFIVIGQTSHFQSIQQLVHRWCQRTMGNRHRLWEKGMRQGTIPNRFSCQPLALAFSSVNPCRRLERTRRSRLFRSLPLEPETRTSSRCLPLPLQL